MATTTTTSAFHAAMSPLPNGLKQAKQPRRLKHIDDLKLDVGKERPSQNASIRALYLLAEKRWKACHTNIEFGRKDLAWVDYTVACDILISLIPKNPGFPTWRAQMKEDYASYCALMNTVFGAIDQFDKLKEYIVEDNKRWGTSSEAERTREEEEEEERENERQRTTNGMTQQPIINGIAAKKKPPAPARKPTALRSQHGISSSVSILYSEAPDPIFSSQESNYPPTTNGTSRPSSSFDTRPSSAQSMASARPSTEDGLAARFNKLRVGTNINGIKAEPPTNGTADPPVRKGLIGPRAMPNRVGALNTDVDGLPKQPSPTYSPVRQYTPDLTMPPPSNTRPIIRSQHSTAYLEKEARQQAQQQTNGTNTSVVPKKALPRDTSISPVKLQDYLMNSNEVSVLVLDVRHRQAFEEGHINCRNIVCIEPTALREEMSAGQLEDALSISPDAEHERFAKRNEYDLVVYHDQSTRSNRYIGGPTDDDSLRALRILVQTIYELAFSKPLKSPPMLLVGGLDAWIDYVGATSLLTGSGEAPRQALIGSRLSRTNATTAAQSSSALAARRKALNRRSSMPGAVLSNAERRELRELNPIEPLNLDEETQWMEQLRKDTANITISPIGEEFVDEKARRRKVSIVSPGFEPNDIFEDFYTRFPETARDSTPPIFSQPDREAPGPPLEAGAAMSYPALPPLKHQPHQIPQMPDEMPPDVPPDADGPPPPVPPYLPQPGAPPVPGKDLVVDPPFHSFADPRDQGFNPPSPSRPAPAVPRKSYSGVSERPMPFAPPLDATVRSLTPQMQITYQPRKKTGLKNLGNTCYMASILQCMAGTTPLARYFLQGSFRRDVNKENKLGSRGLFAETFASLLIEMSNPDVTYVAPTHIKTISGRLNEQFRGRDQQDSQEFLDFFLDTLHEDLNPSANHDKFAELTEAEERQRESLPVQLASYYEWDRYCKTNSSVVVKMFQGQFSSRLQCLKCGHTSTTYNSFMYLSVPIPAAAAKGNGQCTIQDCLNEFTKQEILDGDDSWHCPICKKLRKASKQLSITRMPPVLIIHLKRFSSTGRWREKITTLVTFGSTTDLTPYGPQVYEGGGVPKVLEVTPPFKYGLYAVANHYGNLTSGHYTAFVKDMGGTAGKEKWTRFDDSRAVGMEKGGIVSRNAYVLFMVRSGVM